MIKTYAVGQITFTWGDLIAPIALAQPCLKSEFEMQFCRLP